MRGALILGGVLALAIFISPWLALVAAGGWLWTMRRDL